jgi:hypothetical protein
VKVTGGGNSSLRSIEVDFIANASINERGISTTGHLRFNEALLDHFHQHLKSRFVGPRRFVCEDESHKQDHIIPVERQVSGVDNKKAV